MLKTDQEWSDRRNAGDADSDGGGDRDDGAGTTSGDDDGAIFPRLIIWEWPTHLIRTDLRQSVSFFHNGFKQSVWVPFAVSQCRNKQGLKYSVG